MNLSRLFRKFLYGLAFCGGSGLAAQRHPRCQPRCGCRQPQPYRG